MADRQGKRILELMNGEVLIDAEGAVLLEEMQVAKLHDSSKQGLILALEMGGRVNRKEEYADVLFLMDAEESAELVALIVAHAYDVSPSYGDQLMARIRRQLIGGVDG